MGLAELTRAQETILWSKAAGMCSKCKSILIKKGREEFYKKGENAHIEGKEPKAARYNSNQTDEERASYLNHILLCADCHTDIDKDPKSYPHSRRLSPTCEHYLHKDSVRLPNPNNNGQKSPIQIYCIQLI